MKQWLNWYIQHVEYQVRVFWYQVYQTGLWERLLNLSTSLAMSTSVLKALPGKLDIKRHSPSILYLYGDILNSLSASDNKTSIIWQSPLHTDWAEIRPPPKVIKLFSCSTQLSTIFILLINVKMLTIVGILTFIIMINTTSERLKARFNFFIWWYLSFYEQLKFCAQLSWAWKFYNLRARPDRTNVLISTQTVWHS